MNVVLITAGGVGKRMGVSIPKQFVEVNGKPIIIHTLEIFDNIKEVDKIVISCVDGWIDELKQMIRDYAIGKILCIVNGGQTGQDSIYNGLCAIDKLVSGNPLILIHDAVRPLILPETIIDNIRKAEYEGCAVTCVHLTETIITCSNNEYSSVDRSSSLIARAPQTFRLNELMEIHERARNDNIHSFVDTCTMMLYYGRKISVVYGSPDNIKITSPSDIFAFKSILLKRESEYYLNQ